MLQTQLNISSFYVHGKPAQVFSPVCQGGSALNCRRFSFFFRKGDERMAERSGQTDQGTQAGAALESILLALRLHALSLIHCLPPSPTLSLSVSFPYSHILLSSSTYFLGGGGGGCRYTTRSSVWETQSKTGTDSPRCTDHSAGLHPLSSPRCCSLILHLKFALCLCWGLLSCHISPVNVLPPFKPRAHKHMRAVARVHLHQHHYCPGRASCLWLATLYKSDIHRLWVEDLKSA